MDKDNSICSIQFYNDVGFKVIKDWLVKNCHCSINHIFFNTLSPKINIDMLKDLQNHTNELLISLTNKNPIPLTDIPNISKWLSNLKIKGNRLNSDNFQELHQILILSTNIKKYIKKSNSPIWYNYSSKLINSKALIAKIEKIFNESFKIKVNATTELKTLTQSILKIENDIKNIIQKKLNRAKKQDWLSGDQVVLRNGRSVLPIKINKKRKIKGIIQGQSSSGQTVFIEPLDIIELNNKITELQYKIIEEKQLILKDLTAFFIPLSDKINETFNILVLLDQHYTMAKFAHQIKAIKPEINTNGEIKVIKAVNPLFILDGKKAIPLNIILKDEKILLLSGPNAGGKTVVLKSIGLYAIMTQCGLFIPAESISLPIFNQFISDIGDGQSMENDLSTFSAHINNLVYIINNSNKKSLILLDELGTGTDPHAGSALSQAILEFLLDKENIVLATTHIDTLKIWASQVKGILNGGMIFDLNALMPTYELLIGSPGGSYTLEIAKRMGLNHNIIKYAKKIMGTKSMDLENSLMKLEKDRLNVSRLLNDLENKEKKIIELEKETFNKNKKINQEFKKAKAIASTEAENIIIAARKNIENLIKNIRESDANKQSIKKAKNHINEELTKIQNQKKENKLNNLLLDKNNLEKGDKIYIPQIKSHGQIIDLPNKQNKLKIEANGIYITLDIAEIQLAEISDNAFHKAKNIKNNKISINKITNLKSNQIDLRGKKVEEALLETERLLDIALISGISTIYILHGKGTGALMNAIHKFLSKQTFLLNYKFANEDQGGTGITVVEL